MKKKPAWARHKKEGIKTPSTFTFYPEGREVLCATPGIGFVYDPTTHRAITISDLGDVIALMGTLDRIGSFTDDARPLFNALVARLVTAQEARHD